METGKIYQAESEGKCVLIEILEKVKEARKYTTYNVSLYTNNHFHAKTELKMVSGSELDEATPEEIEEYKKAKAIEVAKQL